MKPNSAMKPDIPGRCWKAWPRTKRRLTGLRPELEVLHAHGGQLVRVVGVAADHEDLVLAAPGNGQPLPLPPVPHHDAVIVVQAHRHQLLAVS